MDATPPAFSGFAQGQLNTLKRLDSPSKVADCVERLKYNIEESGDTAYSPKLVLERREAHCLEGALLAACAFRFHGLKPLLVDLRTVRDEDHVLCVYKLNGRWGSIAKSKFTGLTLREPVYHSLRELVFSYFDFCYNYAGEKTLREYSSPVNLARFDSVKWMTSNEPLDYVVDALEESRHYPVLPKGFNVKLNRVKGVYLKAGTLNNPRKH